MDESKTNDAAYNFVEIHRLISTQTTVEKDAFNIEEKDITLLDVLYTPSLNGSMKQQFKNILVFDALYNNIVTNFGEIAEESKEFQSLSEDTLKKILDTSLEKVASNIDNAIEETDSANSVDGNIKSEFAKWLGYFVKFDKRGNFLNQVEEWKRVNFPRMSDSLLVLITYFFETLVPRFIEAQLHGKSYTGTINPGRIGKRKDFWNQLNITFYFI